MQLLILDILSDRKAKWRVKACLMFCFTDCNNLSCCSQNRDGNIHVQMNIKGCIWQTLNDVWSLLSAVQVEQLSLQIIQRVMPAANPGWSVITPVEEPVTFKMAHSQGSLPVIRNVYYGLWSHPANVRVCGCESVCICTLTSLWAEGQSGCWKLFGFLTWTYISLFSSL